MDHLQITNDTELHHRIMKLNYLRAEQELAIKRNVKELMYSVTPSNIIHNIIHDIAENKETTGDLKSIGLNMGKDFLLMKLFGNSGIKGFVSSMLVKKATDYVVKNHSDLLSSGIHKLQNFMSSSKQKTTD